MSTAKAASALQSRLLGDKDQWTSTVMTWRYLQRELVHRPYPVNPSEGSAREECRDVVQISFEQTGATEKKRKSEGDALIGKSEENAKKG